MMITVTKKGTQDDVWYVDSCASNHYVQIGDDSCHPITHIGKVPLALHDGKTKSLSDVLHVPSIIKNLVSVGQMVEQGLQVRFNAKDCFVEDFNDRNLEIQSILTGNKPRWIDVNHSGTWCDFGQ